MPDLTPSIQVLPVTAERWPDLEALFGKNGAYSSCWCMWWRLKHAEFHAMSAEVRRSRLQALTLENQAPGLLAYAAGEPAGWCSLGPREDFPALEKSKILKRVDDRPVWSIVCYFVKRGFRGQGVAHALLAGALDYAFARGAVCVEGYPVDLQSPKLAGKKLTGCGGYMGIASIYRALGFVEVARASETQLIMRRENPSASS